MPHTINGLGRKENSVGIAEQLNRLFEDTAGLAGRPVTMQEIINRMNEGGIATMSLSYLQQLRTGQASNPRLQHLRALAHAFDVPLSYFIDDDDDYSAASIENLAPHEQSIALRVHGLSPDALRSVRAVIELARKSERIDEEKKDSL